VPVSARSCSTCIAMAVEGQGQGFAQVWACFAWRNLVLQTCIATVVEGQSKVSQTGPH